MDLRGALATVADELYALPREEFIAARGELVRRARADGERELAAAIGTLRRPTAAAWLLNRLARERPDSLDRLASLGAQLRAAHEQLDGPALRRLSGARRELLAELDTVAREVGATAGVAISDATARELAEMFAAGLAQEAAGRLLAAGRLSSAKALTEADGEWPAVNPGARPRPTLVPALPAPGRGPSAAVQRARAELERLETAVAETRRRFEQAGRDYDEAAEEETDAHQAVAHRRAELVAAEQAEQRARQRARFARRAREDADREHAQAQRRARTARERLEVLDTT
jgi:hypothetical protein